jgi:trans-aconitate methyltransferase
VREDTNLEHVWQNYIDGTVGRPLYYLYQDVISNHFNSAKVGRALSLGCGAGNEEVDLLKNGWEVNAIDNHKRSQEILNERAKNLPGKLHFQLGNFAELKMDGHYDLVLALFSLPFGKKDELAKLLERVTEHLKPGSLFAANFFGSTHSFVKKSIAYSLNINEIAELFSKNNFKISYSISRKFNQLDFSGNKTAWDLIEIIVVKN